MDERRTILELEQLTLATSPALREAQYDGWVLRASGTDTRRANSITQLTAGSLPLAEKVQHCERWYADAKQPTTFRLTSALSPPLLDANLAERGYVVHTPSHVMTAELSTLPGAAPEPHIVVRTLEEGIADLHHLKGSDDALILRDQQRQAKWTLPEQYLAWMDQGEVLASGLVRVDGPWAGLFNMRTAGIHRRRGLASALVTSLLNWAREHGARRAFLQVEQTNEPAVQLYRRAGFTPCYDYHYRVQP